MPGCGDRRATPVLELMSAVAFHIKPWMKSLWCCLTERRACVNWNVGGKKGATERDECVVNVVATYHAIPRRISSFLVCRCRSAPAWARDNGWRTTAWPDEAEAWPTTSTRQLRTGLCTSCPWGTVSRPFPSTKVSERYGAAHVGRDKHNSK